MGRQCLSENDDQYQNHSMAVQVLMEVGWLDAAP
jgi:hypothetical protein